MRWNCFGKWFLGWNNYSLKRKKEKTYKKGNEIFLFLMIRQKSCVYVCSPF